MSTEKVYEKNIVVATTARLMIPFIQLFGLYVMVGTEGAGGGFQGGVIIAASFILYSVAFGVPKARLKMKEAWNTLFKSLGLLFYAGIGLLCIVFSFGIAEYLNYSALPLSAIVGVSETRGWIIADVVEIGIGITVMASFVSLFFDLVWKEEERRSGEGEDK